MKRAYIFMLSLLLMIGIVIVASFAWFTNSEFIEPDLSGFSISAYFGGGDGSSEDPYQIKNPRHLYNLAWLQYLGYFNNPGTGNTPNPNSSSLTQYSFEITEDLPMSGWVLPPIGTSEQPFIGLLNGNGHKITNLQTSNEFHDFGSRHPNTVTATSYINAEIIGFIGAIGEISTMEDYGHTISSAANAVANIKLVDTIISSSTENTLVGIAAGYINGKVEDVGIVNGTIDVIGSTKLDNMEEISSFTVAGYAEDGYVYKYSNNKAIVLNPTETIKTKFVFEDEGDVTGWGGSIDMASLYSRINAQTNTLVTTYVSGEIHYYDVDGNEIGTPVIENTLNPTDLYNEKTMNYYYDNYGSSGGYLTVDTAPTTVATGYDYLTGLYKTVITIGVKETTDGYKIKNPDNVYLKLKSDRVGSTIQFTSSIAPETDVDKATIWKQTTLGNGFSLSAYNPDDGQLYYLGTTNYSTLSLSITNQFIWDYDSNYGYFCTNNNTTYYLRYISGNWCVSDKKSYYITDNNGNYMKRNGTAIDNTDDFTEATKWIFENESTQSGIIYDESDTSYRLYTNGTTLTTNSTGTSWSNSNYKIYNDSNFIVFDGTWKIQHPDTYYIKYNTNYLSLNQSGNITNAIENEASSWRFSDDTNKRGYISTTIDDTVYYLSFNNSTTNKLQVTTDQSQALEWSNDGNGAYYTYNNAKYYLQYKNSTWQAAQATLKSGNKISYDNIYLNVNSAGTGLEGGNDSNSATIWFLENNHIYCYIGTTKKYLYYTDWSSGTLGLTTNSTETYMPSKSNKTLRTGSRGSYYYVYYYNGQWTDSGSQKNLEWDSGNIEDLTSTPIPTIAASPNGIVNAARTSISKPNTIRNLIQNGFTVYDIDSQEKPSLFNYIPLNTNDNSHTVKSNNTGYIMSGGHSGPSGSANLRAVDIRVAGAATAYTISSRLTKSVNNDGTIKVTNNKDQVYTCDATQEHLIDTTKYQKYATSKESMVKTFKTAVSNNNSRVGGIHFIDSAININRLVVAPSVLINGQTYTNYEMPENCIDFKLKTKGYINFFASLYYGGNTSFFSLHQIKRDSNNKIEEINHIKEIYESTDKSLPYIYKYKSADKNGNIYSNDSNSLPSGYSKIFDTDWIESPNLGGWDKSNYMTKLYYYEIPVNEGEYALGSVEGADGGYLLYLDIGANAQEVDRTEIRQKSTFTQYDYVFPKGIAIILATANIDDKIGTDSLNASLSSVAKFNTNGSIGVTRTSDTVIDVTTNMIDVTSSYIPRTITLNKNSSAMTAAAVKTTTSIYSQIQYIDYNMTTGKVYKTDIERVTTVTGSTSESADPTVKIYNYTTNEEVDLTVAKPEWKLYGIVIDGGSNKNRSFALSETQDNSDGKGSERTTLYNNLIDALDELDAATETSVLEFDYDALTSATNTYSISINTTLDSSTTVVKYYYYSGNEIEVTTTNDGGSTIYVTVVASKDSLNNDITFKINSDSDSDTVSQGDTITLTQTTS